MLQKILVLSSAKNSALIRLLKSLFPECIIYAAHSKKLKRRADCGENRPCSRENKEARRGQNSSGR